MFKVVFYLWRKPTITRAAFIEYYETQHAPFVSRHVQIRGYRRNFPRWESATFAARPLAASSRFDVMTEMWADSAEAFGRELALSQQEPLKNEWEADEAKFIDRSRMLLLHVVDENPQGPPPRGRQIGKIVRFICASGDLHTQAPAQSTPMGVAAVRRNLVQHDHPLTQKGNPAVQASDFAQLNLARIDEFWTDGDAPPPDAGDAITVRVDEYTTDALEVPCASA